MNEEQIKKIRNGLIWTLEAVVDISERDISRVFNRSASTINRILQDKPTDWDKQIED